MTEQENKTEHLKFYSKNAIGLGTFLGGPLAAGFLIRENYVSLSEPEKGKRALFIGIITTILLLVGIFIIPEQIMSKVPQQILPALYTGAIFLIVEKIHGKILTQHKENDNEFFPIWKSAIVGIISLALILGGIFGVLSLSPENENELLFNAKMEEFSKNEAESILFYERLETASREDLLQELKTVVIPNWEENIEILKEAKNIENLETNLMVQNDILLRYSKLRIEESTLFVNAIAEDTDEYNLQIQQVQQKINVQLSLLEQ